MEKKRSRRERVKGKLKETYRLIILDHDTLQEINSYSISIFSIVLSVTAFLTLMATVFFLLLAFTPLKRLIPGYGTIESNREVIALFNKVSELEDKVASQKLYIEKFRHYVTGEIPNQNDSINVYAEIPEQSPVERIEEDELLRQEIELEQKLIESASANKSVMDIDFVHVVRPLEGPVSSAFDPSMGHFGVDIMAAKSTPIKAALEGTVISADWTLLTGHSISIQHENNVVTAYKHNSSLLKEIGAKVAAGEAIAIIGNSGTLSNGPHLHFEIWQNGEALNPELYIDFD